MKNKISWDSVLYLNRETYRHSAEKDYDKIVFSQAFRRLANKTQVHPLAQNDHVHNRMSHSIEVSSVCRSLVTKLVYDKLIPRNFSLPAVNTIMAAGLGHDMGNPPFGHLGEESISKWISSNEDKLINLGIKDEIVNSYKSYDGNAQNFHIFNTYEYFSKKPISHPTIATMVKYPIVSSNEVKKSGCFSIEKGLFDECFSQLKLKNGDEYLRHPLSYLLEAADDICYGIMDIDDAIEIDYLQNNSGAFSKIVKELFEFKSKTDNYKNYREKRGEIIEKAINDITDVFNDRYTEIMNGQIEYKNDLLKIGKDKKTIQSILKLKTLAASEVFKHRRKVQFETASYSILHRIFDNWFEAFTDYKINNWNIKKCDTYSKKVFQMLDMYQPDTELLPKIGKDGFIQIIDFVSGCTDRYANDISLAFLGIVK